jgi:hypothetical protein
VVVKRERERERERDGGKASSIVVESSIWMVMG